MADRDQGCQQLEQAMEAAGGGQQEPDPTRVQDRNFLFVTKRDPARVLEKRREEGRGHHSLGTGRGSHSFLGGKGME